MPTKTPLIKTAKPAQQYESVHGGIVDLLQSTRVAAARSVNALMTASYWEIGRRIVEAEQGGSARAGYGQQLLMRLSTDLTAQFGRGFSTQNLDRMRNFYLAYPPELISSTVSRKFKPVVSLQNLSQIFILPWSAYISLMSVKNPQARAFYEAEALRGAGAFGSLIAKSMRSSLSVRRYRVTKRPCSQRA